MLRIHTQAQFKHDECKECKIFDLSPAGFVKASSYAATEFNSGFHARLARVKVCAATMSPVLMLRQGQPSRQYMHAE